MTHDVTRFERAQSSVYETVLRELRRGRKESHWMWYVFPQLAGLGHSTTARQYAIVSLDEAVAYARHPVLGMRLRECTALVLAHRERSLIDIFGDTDAMKFRSCMTLFSLAAPDEQRFREALLVFCDGEPDPATLRLLEHRTPQGQA